MRRALTALLLAAVAVPAAAQDLSTPPPIGAPKPFKLPATESYTLPNGLQVTLVPYGTAPKAVVYLAVRAGNATEGPQTWIADVTGEMLKEGAGGRSSGDIARAAAAMGGDLDVGTGVQQTSVTLNVLSESAPAAVDLVGAVALHPEFPASELDRIKANYARRLAQALSQPGTLADAALARAYYGPDHPYGRSFPTQAQLAGYTLDDVKRFYAANFGARRAHLYIAGQFDRAAVKAAIAKAFTGWAPGTPVQLQPPSPRPGPQVILVDRPGAPQSTIRLAFAAPRAGTQADIPLRVSNALLGGAFSSRITRNIREDKGYTYSPGSGLGFQPDDALWSFEADITTASTGPAMKEVFGEIRRLQATAPGEDEANGIRTYLAGTFVIRNSTAPSLVGSLATRDVLGLPADWLDRYVPSVLAVTPGAISGSVKAALPLDKLTLVVVGDLKTVEPQLKALPELANVPFQRVTVP